MGSAAGGGLCQYGVSRVGGVNIWGAPSSYCRLARWGAAWAAGSTKYSVFLRGLTPFEGHEARLSVRQPRGARELRVDVPGGSHEKKDERGDDRLEDEADDDDGFQHRVCGSGDVCSTGLFLPRCDCGAPSQTVTAHHMSRARSAYGCG